MNKILKILKRDGVYFTSKRLIAWLIGHTPLWSHLSFNYYKNYRLVFAPSMLTYVLFANPHTRDEDLKIIEKFVHPGSVVIDIGAHIGSTVIVEASQAGHTGQVLAFEASPGFYTILQKNIYLNKLESVVSLYPYAIGNDASRVHINEDVKDDTTNFISKTGTEVKQVTLDEYTKDFTKIDFIKIDVEGYEPMVLAGAKNTLEKTECLYIEFCTSNLENLGFNTSSVIEVLQKNFNMFTNTEGILNPFIYKNQEQYAMDLICIKK